MSLLPLPSTADLIRWDMMRELLNPVKVTVRMVDMDPEAFQAWIRAVRPLDGIPEELEE